MPSIFNKNTYSAFQAALRVKKEKRLKKVICKEM
jgi:hypothetical protein